MDATGAPTRHNGEMSDSARTRQRLHALPPRPAWVGDLIAAAVIVVLPFVPFPGHGHAWENPLTLAVMLAPAVLLPLRRRWPVPILGAVIALYGIAALIGTLSPGIIIASAIAMFGVANRLPRRQGLIVTLCAVVAVGLVSVLAALGGVFDPRVVQFVVTVAFAAAAGDATRSRREYIEAVTERAERAEQTRESEARRRVTEERLRIARDLHDTVAHQIAVISLNAGVATSAFEDRPEKAREALASIRSAARTVLGEIGDLLEVLRRDDDPDEPSASPQLGLDRLDELVGQFRDAGLAVTVRTEGDLAAITGVPALVAYRVVHEALTNALKHGAERQAHLLVTVREHRASIIATNPRPPGLAPAVDAGGGHGLLGLRERVASVRGTVEAGIAPGGYRLAVTLPLGKEAAS